MTLLADSGARARRFQRRFVHDDYHSEPRNNYGEWTSGNGAKVGLTASASALGRFARHSTGGARFAIGADGGVAYGDAVFATHHHLEVETGVEAQVRGYARQKNGEFRYSAWKVGGLHPMTGHPETGNSLTGADHPFLAKLEGVGFKPANLEEAGYFDGRALDVLFDSAVDQSRDPMQCGDIRLAFEVELKRRWQNLDRVLTGAIANVDALGLSPQGPLALIPTADRMAHFQKWLDELLNHLVVGDGDWMKKYVDEVCKRAASRAERLGQRKTADELPWASDTRLRAAHLIAGHKTLYVSRPLINGDELVSWAKASGFATTLPADDMHVTVCFSKSRVDWEKISPNSDDLTVVDGARSLMQFGDAIVLKFENHELERRHSEFMDIGASWDHDVYQPHITITWNVGGFDWKKVEPFHGRLTLGPEEFAVVKEGWKESIIEDVKLRKAAGIMFVDPDGNALFLHRVDGEGWAFPGGGIDGAESAENAAVRESQEEAGGAPMGAREVAWRSDKHGADYTTFRQDIVEQFTPSLNHEHDDWRWAPMSNPPRPLHPGVKEMLRGKGLMDGQS